MRNISNFMRSITSKSPSAEAISPFPPASSSSGLILVRRLEINLARISLILSMVNPLSSGLKIVSHQIACTIYFDQCIMVRYHIRDISNVD